MYKISVAQFAHESNTFAKFKTNIDRFEQTALFEGQEIIDFAHCGVEDYMSGMIKEAEKHPDIILLPCYSAYSMPSGIISKECFDTIKNNILNAFQKHKKEIDGVCFAMHGAGCSESYMDVEGEILKEVREILGTEIPIIVTLDLHANISMAMEKYATILLSVKSYPHSDCHETGKKAMNLLYKVLKGEVNTYMSVHRLPMLIQMTKGLTTQLPMQRIKDICIEMEKRPGIVDCSFAHGFPCGDTPFTGASALTIATEQHLAESVADELAQIVWDNREDFYQDTLSVNEGLKLALSSSQDMIVINELSDNPGAGTPGDGTYLLNALIENNVHNCCFASIVDPETVETCIASGVGNYVDVKIGGKIDGLHGKPIDVKGAYIKSITDGEINLKSNMMKGYPTFFGKSVRLIVNGVDIIICQTPNQIMDDGIFELHGINIKKRKIIAIKSAVHFRDYFTSHSNEIITVDSPGISTVNFKEYNYKNIKHPIFPFELRGNKTSDI
jgi:microcystin degradation protein MlrC